MGIEIDPKYIRRIEELASASGRSVDDVFREVLEKGLGALRDDAGGEGAKTGEKQRAALKDLIKRLDALPAEGLDDGFSGKDHDSALYGQES